MSELNLAAVTLTGVDGSVWHLAGADAWVLRCRSVSPRWVICWMCL